MTAARIDGIVARDSNVAVVLRRGPSRWTEQLVWDLSTDEVRRGQWIKGRVYTRRCDVSPDGRYLVGAYTNYSSSHRRNSGHNLGDDWMSSGWTAVSRPPYFTALALWFTGGAWNGGGMWVGPRDLRVNKFPHCWREAKSAGRHIRIRDLKAGIGEDEPIFSMLLKRRGWTEERAVEVDLLNPSWRKSAMKFLETGIAALTDATRLDSFIESLEDLTPRYRCRVEGVWRKGFERGSLVRIDRYRSETWQIRDADDAVRREFQVPQFGSQWLDIDAQGQLVFGDQGCLWRWPDFPDGNPTMVADLNADGFVALEPPDWALEWDG